MWVLRVTIVVTLLLISLLTWRSGRPFSLLQDPGAEKHAGVAFGV